MTTIKISQMTAATSIDGTELVEIVQGGATKRATTLQLLQNPTNPGNAAGVVYNPLGTGNVATNAQAKFREWMTITDFGAVGDDSTNNTTALTNAAAAAKAAGKPLFIPVGIFRHNSTWTIDSIVVFGPGTLKSTDTTSVDPSHAIIMIGTGVALRDVTLTTTWAGARQANDNSSAIVINSTATRFEINNVKILAGASTGMIFNSPTHGRVINNYVTGTLADGIHMTAATSDILVANNLCYATGDDGIAVVGYVGQGQPTGIHITGNRCFAGLARGIACVGGARVSIIGNAVEQSFAAGIYVASESSFTTFAASDVAVMSNRVVDCNTDAGTGHGGIFLTGYSGHVCTNIDIIGNTLTWTGTVACVNARGIVARDGNFISRPRIKNNVINGSPLDGIDIGCFSPEVVGNTVYRSTFNGIVINDDSTGVPIVTGNTIYNSNTSAAGGIGHIDIEVSSATQFIINNNVITDGTNVPDGGAIRNLSTRQSVSRRGNVYNGAPMLDWCPLTKASTVFTYNLNTAFSGLEEINEVEMASGNTFKIVLSGVRHFVRIMVEAVRDGDPAQWAQIDERWNFTTAAGVGTSGVNFVNLTANRYQRTAINNSSNGTSLSITAMSADASDNVTVTFTAAAIVNVRFSIRTAYKSS